MTPRSRHGLLLSLLLLACAAALLAVPAQARVRPGDMTTLVSPGYQPKDTDERGMWQTLERVEHDLSASNLLVRDPELNAYVRDICERLLGDTAKDLRIYIVHDPDFNASMFPNGMMVVHTGLLARMRNEAQLAAVLGHEAGHYLRRHSLHRWRDIKTKSAVMSVVGIAAAGAGGGSWYDVANGVNIAIMLSVLSFSREHESEADAYGLKLMDDGLYPADAASQVWAQLIEERKASALARKKKYRDRSSSVLSTHPPTDDRMQDLALSAAELQKPDPDGARYNPKREEYLAAIAPHRSMLLEEQIKLNDPGASLYLVNALAQDGWDSTLRFYEGEAHRLRDEPGDAALAATAYAAAVEFPEALPVAYRAHGYALIKAGDQEGGRRALERYLELQPQATDAAMVRFSLQQ